MIGIFGGTFDPVHLGHLRAALEVCEQLGMEDFRWVPAGQPPHRKRPVSPPEHRLAMLELALAGQAAFRIDERELRREGPSYMVDTLSEIRSEHPSAPILLIIGQDSANALDGWHRWRDLFALAHLVIMRRSDTPVAYAPDPGAEIEARAVDTPAALAGATHGGVYSLPVTALAIASTDIRALVRAGRSPRYLTPDAVVRYIEAQGLYRG